MVVSLFYFIMIAILSVIALEGILTDKENECDDGGEEIDKTI